jgi:hypothetical protein
MAFLVDTTGDTGRTLDNVHRIAAEVLAHARAITPGPDARVKSGIGPPQRASLA